MNLTDKNIHGGKTFDWGKTSAGYAKFRDIYPQEFYDSPAEFDILHYEAIAELKKK